MDVAERLSLWVSAFEAIRLQAAQQAIAGIRSAATPERDAPPVTHAALAEDVRRVRSVLAKAIAQPVDVDEIGFVGYRRRQHELQRQMELLVGPLRDHVRQSLARLSPQLRQLAALDAVMEELLASRAHALLPMTVRLAERRFAQLQPSTDSDSDGDGGTGDTAWRADFETEWRQALHAELDLRLEPVMGLVEALGNE